MKIYGLYRYRSLYFFKMSCNVLEYSKSLDHFFILSFLSCILKVLNKILIIGDYLYNSWDLTFFVLENPVLFYAILSWNILEFCGWKSWKKSKYVLESPWKTWNKNNLRGHHVSFWNTQGIVLNVVTYCKLIIILLFQIRLAFISTIIYCDLSWPSIKSTTTWAVSKSIKTTQRNSWCF